MIHPPSGLAVLRALFRAHNDGIERARREYAATMRQLDEPGRPGRKPLVDCPKCINPVEERRCSHCAQMMRKRDSRARGVDA